MKCVKCHTSETELLNLLCNDCNNYSGEINPKEDMINTPPHYTQWGIEPIDYITSNKMNFCEWACIKYITRHKYKNWLEDLKKARWFLERLIKEYEND